MKIKHSEYGSLKLLEFVGENCDVYTLRVDNIIEAKFNGKDINDFIKCKEKIVSYVIKIKNIWERKTEFANRTYAIPYSYCDFCNVIFQFNNKEIDYELEWLTDLDYKDYSQSVKKIKEGYQITYDLNRKRNVFKSYYFEQFVKDELSITYDTPLKESDVLKITEINNLNPVFFKSEDEYEDLLKFKNVKKLCVKYFDEERNLCSDLNKIIDALPQLEELELEHPFSKEELKSLYKLKNLKAFYMSDIYVDENYDEDKEVIADIKTLNLPFKEKNITWREMTKLEIYRRDLTYLEYVKKEISKRKYKNIKRHLITSINKLH